MFNFIKEKWDYFISHTEKWYDGKKNVIVSVEERLKNPQVPEGKKWVYLCNCFASDDLPRIKKILKVYANTKNAFTKKMPLNYKIIFETSIKMHKTSNRFATIL